MNKQNPKNSQKQPQNDYKCQKTKNKSQTKPSNRTADHRTAKHKKNPTKPSQKTKKQRSKPLKYNTLKNNIFAESKNKKKGAKPLTAVKKNQTQSVCN